jgi:hypothetical protein
MGSCKVVILPHPRRSRGVRRGSSGPPVYGYEPLLEETPVIIVVKEKNGGLGALATLKTTVKNIGRRLTGGGLHGISNGETVRQLKKLMKGLESEKRGQAEEMKAILTEQASSQYFVHPYSGHVYAVTGRYPYRIGDLLPSLWGALDGPAAPAFLLSGGISGASGLAYTTYDAWGQPVYGMPIRAYKESEDEAFMQSMERQEAPWAKYVDPRGGEAPYPGTVKPGYAPSRYIIDKPPGWVEGLLGSEQGISVWKLDSVLTGHWWAAHYAVPYYDKKGHLKVAIGRHQWEAEDQYAKLLQAGVAKAPYHGEIDPTAFGFDTATRMG